MLPRTLPHAFALLSLAYLGGGSLPAAQAGGPAAVEVAGEEALFKGTLEGLSLGSDGVLRLGPTFDAQPLDAPTAWSAAASGDALWVGCGNDATLRRIGKDGQVLSVGLGEGLMVTALAALPGGGVAAAVFPGGRILKVDAAGEKVEPLAAIQAEHVWALLSDERGTLTVASGVPGALWSVDPFGAVAKLADVDDEHARALAGTTDDLLVGTGGKGRVLRRKGGALTVLRDLEQDEVVGLVRLSDGSLIVAANTDAAGGNAQQLATLVKQVAQPPATRGEQKPQERPALQDGALLHLETSGAVTTLWQAKKTALLSLAADGSGAVAGVYPSARVLRVTPGAAPAVLADLPEAEASVLWSDAHGLAGVVTSNPAVLHRRRAATTLGTYTSAPLDAGAVARWGRLRAAGAGITSAQWRAGETSEPDASWSAWTHVGGFDGAAGSTGSTARFLQVRLVLSGPASEVRSLSVVAEPPNRAPTLSDLTLAKPKKDADGPSPQRVIAWKVQDADEDDLLTTLEVQREGSSRWSALVQSTSLEKPGHDWDTAGLPDGLYRLRLTVSDAPSNPVERARSAVLLSPPQRIDNTAPRVSATARLVGNDVVVEGEAQDQPGGQVRSVRISIDGGPWQVLAARDGLFDGPNEAFHASLPAPEPGEHDLVVQALDADSNPGATALTFVSRPPAR